MMSQLSGRMPRLRSRARVRPAAMPVTTTRAARPIVTHTPARRAGRAGALTRVLKNVSTKRSQRDTVGSVPLDLADERAGPLVGGALEDHRGRALLHDRTLVHAEHPTRRVAGEAH